ncbi:MAG: ABC transporter permease [bacterium]|nr:ABC transporter permease [bacterium]MDE0288704.1 ABC transporter permease [bacterium]MDE0437976.1 ABC transporter permease [bacterium]
MDRTQQRQAESPRGRRRAARRYYRRPIAVFSLAALTLIVVAAASADWIAPFNPSEQHLDRILEPPGRVFLLGTDTLGRDNLSRILHGGRVSLLVGGAVAVISGVLGTLVGLVAGYYGGRVDSILMRLTDTLLALPALMVVIMAARILGDGVWDVVLVLAGITWMVPARIVRGKVLALKEREFVEAARALGLTNRRIMYRHLLPNLVGEVMVAVSLTVAAAILAESTLSFLGLGVNPAHTATWGNMLGGNEGFVTTAPWLVWAPGLAIVITALCVNFIGDGLRDALDPTRDQI